MARPPFWTKKAQTASTVTASSGAAIVVCENQPRRGKDLIGRSLVEES